MGEVGSAVDHGWKAGFMLGLTGEEGETWPAGGGLVLLGQSCKDETT